jgi:hypothetical protein
VGEENVVFLFDKNKLGAATPSPTFSTVRFDIESLASLLSGKQPAKRFFSTMINADGRVRGANWKCAGAIEFGSEKLGVELSWCDHTLITF